MKQSTKELCQLELGYMKYRVNELRKDVEGEKNFALDELLLALCQQIFALEQSIQHF